MPICIVSLDELMGTFHASSDGRREAHMVHRIVEKLLDDMDVKWPRTNRCKYPAPLQCSNPVGCHLMLKSQFTTKKDHVMSLHKLLLCFFFKICESMIGSVT